MADSIYKYQLTSVEITIVEINLHNGIPYTGKMTCLHWIRATAYMPANYHYQASWPDLWNPHYSDIMMSALVSQITGVSIVCSAVCSGIGQRKHQSTASLAFVRGNHRWPMDSPHTGPVTRKMFPFGDVIMLTKSSGEIAHCQSLQIAHIPPSWLKREVCLRKKTNCIYFKNKIRYGECI